MRSGSEEGSCSRLIDFVLLNSRFESYKEKEKATTCAGPGPDFRQSGQNLRIHCYLNKQRVHFCFETFHSRLLSCWAALADSGVRTLVFSKNILNGSREAKGTGHTAHTYVHMHNLRALPTESKVESGTSHSKRSRCWQFFASSVNFPHILSKLRNSPKPE